MGVPVGHPLSSGTVGLVQRGRIALTAMTLATLVAMASCLRNLSSGSDPACPPGGVAAGKGCACRGDLRLLLGACVSPTIAAEHCGASASMTVAGCAPRPACERGQARDLVSGGCMVRRDVRMLATSLGILLVADDDLVGCASGAELVTSPGELGDGSPQLGCLPPRGPAASTCPAGSILGEDGRCARVYEGGTSPREARVDVVRWLQASIGPEGGSGAPHLCDALARSPAALSSNAATAGSSPRLVVTLEFPDNDISLVSARTQGGTDAAANAELERVVYPMIEALRSFGGSASQASVGTSVNCRRPTDARAPERPSAMPAVPAVP